MKFGNNPHAVYSGALSGYRNMFLSSSIAVVIIGFSDKFKNKNISMFVKIVGAIIFMLSITIGILTDYDFRFYLDNFKHELPDYIPVENWYIWSSVVYIYTLLIGIVGGIYLFREVL